MDSWHIHFVRLVTLMHFIYGTCSHQGTTFSNAVLLFCIPHLSIFDQLKSPFHVCGLDNLCKSVKLFRDAYTGKNKVMVHGVARKSGRGLPRCIIQDGSGKQHYFVLSHPGVPSQSAVTKICNTLHVRSSSGTTFNWLVHFLWALSVECPSPELSFSSPSQENSLDNSASTLPYPAARGSTTTSSSCGWINVEF